MNVRIQLALALMTVPLLVACGTTSSSEMSIAPLPTAHIVQHPTSAVRVIPLTPTPAATAQARTAALAEPSAAPIAPSPSGSAAVSNAIVVPEAATATAATSDPAALEAQLVVAINQVRAENGLPPYLHNPELSAVARGHSCDLATHGLISHTSSDGRTLAQRLAGSDPAWEWPSESIAAGTPDPAAVVAMWMDEPPDGWHRRNILDTDQREVGVGYCYSADDPTGNHSYWTADFSRHGGT